jgi:uncharacterized protein
MKTCDESVASTMVQPSSLPPGQQQARTRWGTHASGAAFDRKKSSYLTEPARTFIAQQALCVVAGLDGHNELSGLLVPGLPGFVQTPDCQTCLLRLDTQFSASRIVHHLWTSSRKGQMTRLGLFFICHPTRERLCVQGMAELLPSDSRDLDHSSHLHDLMWIHLYVLKSFFHCAKYIKTRIPGLTIPAALSSEQTWRLQQQLDRDQAYLSEAMQAFIAQQALCFLCTVDHEGQCAVNHRGGAPGFLVTLPPAVSSPGGTILLPDYSGNGAFEALGNILETGQAAVVIPNYAAQLALCVSGSARILEVSELDEGLARKCPGAERVVALAVQRVEVQRGDWSIPLAYEHVRAQMLQARD